MVACVQPQFYLKREMVGHGIYFQEDEDKVIPFHELNVKNTELYLSTTLNAGFASNLSSLWGMYNFIQKLQASKKQNKYRITSK